MTIVRPSLGFIGAGKVGSTLARLWYRAGYEVRAVYSLHRAETLAMHVGAKVASSLVDVVDQADLTLLTVPDDVISTTAEALVAAALSGKAIIHTSGAQDASILSSLAAQGAMVGSLHPAFPFADADTAVWNLPGATFAIETESRLLRRWLVGMVKALDGRLLFLAPGQKALYHSALVIASNYTVTLYALAERLLVGIGADRTTADHALTTLLQGTLENLRTQGIPAALTGPLVRADVNTIQTHLDALRGTDEALAGLYIQLARLSFPMLAARELDFTKIEQLFRQDKL